MKFNVGAIATAATSKMHRPALVLAKYSPVILTGVGVVGMVGATVLACRATLKAETIVIQTKSDLDMIHEARDLAISETAPVEYSTFDYRRDLSIAYTRAGVSFLKLYLPSLALGAVSISCILGGQGIMWKRNAAIGAAYKGLQKSFSAYRERVAEEFGPEKERDIRQGDHEEIVTTEKDGEKVEEKVRKAAELADISPYAKIFDEYNSNWQRNADYNRMFLQTNQRYANDKLNSMGHIFLNEVYDMLGFPRTSAGAMVGWIKDGEGDNFVDFGLVDLDNEQKRDFINGWERSIILDFNVDGVIYNMI